jgi:Tfp pilus assembly ATPase PilU
MAMEILVPNSAIRNLIREDKIHQIYSIMQTGNDKYGMQTLNQSLAALYRRRDITLEVAMAISSNQEELLDLVGRGKHPAPVTGVAVAAREGIGGTIPQIRSKFREGEV